MDGQEQQLVERIKQAQNVLVTVTANPSVDQLSAAIGLTLALNKLDKHATAVFSGQVPSTLEFLKPEETLEKNTDSLRDFIIALDKSKADKLRYKVEDDVVRIFITPYRTSLSQSDLQFSQGDFNVDVVVALGVTEQKDLDQAITAHGRILHDATVASVQLTGKSTLGTINWIEDASSLSELMLYLVDGLDKNLLDEQIATALLTGVVASTDRFRNEKTTPQTMNASAELMAAGANQQLIATQLEEPSVSVRGGNKAGGKSGEPGTLAIDHPDAAKEITQKEQPSDIPEAPERPSVPQEQPHEAIEPTPEEMRAPAPEADLFGNPAPLPPPATPQIHVDETGQFMPLPASNAPLPALPQISGVHIVDEGDEPHVDRHHESMMPMAPAANGYGEESVVDPLSLPPIPAILSHNESVLPGSSRPPSLVAPQAAPDAPLTTGPVAVISPQVAQPQPVAAPAPVPSPVMPPAPSAPPQPPVLPAGPLPTLPTPTPVAPPAPPLSPPPISPASATFRTNETLSELEEAVHSPHVAEEDAQLKATASTEKPTVNPATNVNDARNAVQAAFDSATSTGPAPTPVVALNAQPLGDQLHTAPSAAPVVPSGPPAPPIAPLPNAGFSEPTPGDTPADAALDMPLPSNPFGPGKQPAGPLAPPIQPLPPAAPPQAAVPPVPPPFVPPMPS